MYFLIIGAKPSIAEQRFSRACTYLDDFARAVQAGVRKRSLRRRRRLDNPSDGCVERPRGTGGRNSEDLVSARQEGHQAHEARHM